MDRYFKGLTVCLCVVVFVSCAHHRERTNKDVISYGIKLAKNDLWEEAAVHWKKVLENDPNNVAALNNLAIAAEVEGYMERAEQIISKAYKLKPDSEIVKKNAVAIQKHSKTLDEIQDSVKDKGENQ
ncbi:hypothetical protein JW979_12795 [bacterium]|nr:hypothetical protein [candidate division CSSED10-310 bacterium]